MAMRIGSTFEHERPSRSRFGSFLGARNIALAYEQDIFIGEVKLHGLIILHRLICQVVREHTAFDGFVRDILDIIFC